MKYVKMLGLLAIGAVALMAFAGTASATLTSPSGTKYGGEIHASSKKVIFDGNINIICENSVVEYAPSSAGSTSGSVTSLSFSSCGADKVTVLKKGTMSIQSNGAIFSSGAEITVMDHYGIFPFTTVFHCIYVTENTNIGTLTEGVAPAIWHIKSPALDLVETDGSCSAGVVWEGEYTINTPSSAIIVD